MVRKRYWFLPFSVFFEPSRVIHVNRQEQSLFPMNEQSFSIRYFHHHRPNRTSSHCLSHKTPASGCPYKFHSRDTTGSSMFAQDLGHLCRGRRIHTSGHSDFGILSNLGASSNCTWVYADAASAACPVQSGRPAKTSITFAAVIDKANNPCSVNTAYAPESSFTMSPRSATRLLYFWCSGSDSAFLR